MKANKTIAEILDWQTHLTVRQSIIQDVIFTKKVHITEKMILDAKHEAEQAITQAMLDALPKKYGLHIVKEMEELKEETKDLHPSSNDYREIERSKSMSMGRKVGFNQAIDQMESAIKKRGSDE